VEDSQLDRSLVISKTGSDTTIVWNPGADKTRGFPDFGDDEWRGSLCVEAANMGSAAITLQPGAVHTLTQRVDVQH
ncbi:MAG: D-hexose-6-phosphate mutarotase, partial [Propionibacteriaceae bacterium]|jgi:glucose-6-phosphate 1-epimerase|nr:D-hexose-6-phosphate mutarotase [Propionibacteriaceae bacterium]